MKTIKDYLYETKNGEEYSVDYSDNKILKLFNKEVKRFDDFELTLRSFLNCLYKTSSKEDKEKFLEVIGNIYNFYKI